MFVCWTVCDCACECVCVCLNNLEVLSSPLVVVLLSYSTMSGFHQNFQWPHADQTPFAHHRYHLNTHAIKIIIIVFAWKKCMIDVIFYVFFAQSNIFMFKDVHISIFTVFMSWSVFGSGNSTFFIFILLIFFRLSLKNITFFIIILLIFFWFSLFCSIESIK